MNRMTYRNRVRWAEDLLGLLEAPKSKGNVSFILHWMGREGTAARFNPLATSWDMEPKGSQSEDFNDAGVKNYKNREEGLEAAFRTLTKSTVHDYSALIDLLIEGTTPEEILASEDAVKDLEVWGSFEGAVGWGASNTRKIDAAIETAADFRYENPEVGTAERVGTRSPGEMPDREVYLGPEDLQLLSSTTPVSPGDPNESGQAGPGAPAPWDGDSSFAIDEPFEGWPRRGSGSSETSDFGDAFYGFLIGDPRANINVGGQTVNIVDYLNEQYVTWVAEDLNPSEVAIRVQEFINKWMPTTQWWQESSPTLRTNSQTWYQQGVDADWDELNPARRALIEDVRRDIEGYARNAGATYTAEQLDEVATTAYLFGFDDEEIRRYLTGGTVYGQNYGDVLLGGEAAAGSEIREILQTIRSTGNEYLIKLPAATEKDIARRIFTGDLDPKNLRTLMQERARLMYGDKLADFYDAGGTTEEFLQTYDPVVTKLLGRKAQWNGTDYSLGQAILGGDRTILRPWAEQADAAPPELNLQRPFTIRETELAVRMSAEFDSSGYALAEMSNVLNTVGAGMGAI
tara:strand:+ start:2430 stop:4145 length:1716 start_codon:yes stop_codon:yes gene_type:complete